MNNYIFLIYVNNFYELSCELCDDEGLMINENFRKNLYEFLINEKDELELKKRLEKEGWFIVDGVAICLDDDVNFLRI